MVSNGSGGFVGFNPNDVQASYRGICETVNLILERFYKRAQEELDLYAEHWASPEAVKFLGKSAEMWNDFLRKSADTLINIVNKIKASAISWGDTTGHSMVLRDYTSTINGSVLPVVSHAKDNINGLVGADNWGLIPFNIVEENDDIYQALNNYASRLGLYGGNQIESLVLSIYETKRRIWNLRNKVLVEINKVVCDVIDKYGDTANQIKARFDALKNPNF